MKTCQSLFFEILMITLVSSPKQHLPKDMQHSVSWFDQLYCINELLANDVLLVSKILLGYEEALWPKKTGVMQVKFWFFLSYLITTVNNRNRPTQH